jgi:hypothetical protein
MPKSIQGRALGRMHDMYMALLKEAAMQACNNFLPLYAAKYERTCECLSKDLKSLFL